VVDALRCAIDIQRTEAERNTGLIDERRLAFRIGINLGDVIVEGDDIHGDGVNFAERLQGLAEPGGITISGTAYDQVKIKLPVGFADLGEQRIKNIADPVRAYRVLMDPAAAGKTIIDAKSATLSRRWPTAVAAVAIVLAIVGGAAAWLRPWEPRIEPASIERMALPLPDKPSIAVLPFVNMSDDPKQEYFVDGMTDGLITELSQVSGCSSSRAIRRSSTRARPCRRSKCPRNSASATYWKAACNGPATSCASTRSSSTPSAAAMSGPTSSMARSPTSLLCRTR